MRRYIAVVLLALGTIPALAQSESTVDINLTAPNAAIEGPFAVGETLSIGVTMASTGDVGVFGVEFALATSSPDVAIQAVTFDPAFGESLGVAASAPGDDGTGTGAGDDGPGAGAGGSGPGAGADDDGMGAGAGDGATSPETAGPRKAFSAVRVQRAATLNRTLGANGQAVPLATVTFEILTDRPFEAEIEIRARGSLIGQAPARTTVLDPATTTADGATGRNTFKIISHGAPTPTTAPGEPGGEAGAGGNAGPNGSRRADH